MTEIEKFVYCATQNSTLRCDISNTPIQVTSESFSNEMGYVISAAKGHIYNCTNNYCSKMCCGKYGISLCLQKSDNGEAKANKNNDKKNDLMP